MKHALMAVVLLMPAQEATMKVADVVGWIEKETKRRFIAEEQVTTVFWGKKLTVGTDTLDARRAYEVGLSLLRTAGLAAIPLEDGTIRLVSSSMAPREQLKVYASAAELPKADEFCTMTVALKHLDAREAHAALINLCNPMSIVPADGARTVIVNDYASNIRKVLDVLKQIDVPKLATSFRIALAVLEATSGAEPSLPEAFKGVDLTSVTSRNRFAIAGEASVRIDVEALRPQQVKAAADVALRLGALLVEFTAARRGEHGPILERFTLREDKEGTSVGPRLLETRVELKEGEWVVVGSVPGGKEGTTTVVLARAK